jgi:uncharacterized protein (DUF433 family)
MTTIEPETVPLKITPDGVWLVGNTRVPVDTVIWAFRDGATAETIVDRYPTLSLADVYLTIAYSLKHPQIIDRYLQDRAKQIESVREENERRFPPDGIRARLLARKQSA